MSDLRSGGRKLSFDVLATTDSFFDDDDDHPPSLLRSDSVQTEPLVNTMPRRKQKNKKKKKKIKPTDADDEQKQLDFVNDDNLNTSGNPNPSSTTSTDCNFNSDRLIINSNCCGIAAMMTETVVVCEEVYVPTKEKIVYLVSSSVRETLELRQRISSVCSSLGEDQGMMMFRIDENVKEVDNGSCSSRNGSFSGKEFDTESMMNQTAEMNVNGHHIGRMLEKEQSLD